MKKKKEKEKRSIFICSYSIFWNKLPNPLNCPFCKNIQPTYVLLAFNLHKFGRKALQKSQTLPILYFDWQCIYKFFVLNLYAQMLPFSANSTWPLVVDTNVDGGVNLRFSFNLSLICWRRKGQTAYLVDHFLSKQDSEYNTVVYLIHLSVSFSFFYFIFL